MRKYNIYINHNHSPEFVQNGWSWAAFFFGGIWTLFKKMWTISAIYWFITLLLVFFSFRYISFVEAAISIYFLHIILGIFGSYFREKSLMKQGHKYVTEAEGIYSEEAQEEFLNLKD